MKRYLGSSLPLAAIVWLIASNTGAFAQGLVVFANGPTTLISYWQNGTEQTVPASEVFYFGLLISESATGPFVFTGVYATNSTCCAGFLGSLSYSPAVPGWAPGTTRFYEVVGWSANMGTAFQQDWFPFPTNPPGFFGISPVAIGVAGGNAPQARLSASISGDSIVVSWTPTGGTLQSSPSLGAGKSWSTVGTANPAKVPIAGNAKFLRVVPDVYFPLPLFGNSGLPGFSLLPPWI